MAGIAEPPKPGKSTCRDCERTVFIVIVSGERVAVDPEIITVIPYKGTSERLAARRPHAELCVQYQRDNHLRKLRIKRR